MNILIKRHTYLEVLTDIIADLGGEADFLKILS